MSRPRVALLAALAASLATGAAPAWAQAPEKPADIVRVENAVIQLATTKRAVAGKVAAGRPAHVRDERAQLVALGGDAGYATFFAFGHSLRG